VYLSENKKEVKAVEDPTEKLHMKLLQLKTGNVNPESYVFSLAETFPAGAAILRVVTLRDTLLRLLSHGKIWQMSPPMALEWIAKHYLRIHGGVRTIPANTSHTERSYSRRADSHPDPELLPRRQGGAAQSAKNPLPRQ
jgi:hypothetical protein